MTADMEEHSLPEEQHQPLVVSRSDHTVSRKFIDSDALKVLYRLRRFGFRPYLCGGGVRDILLGKTPKDFDVVTDARPSEIRKLFRNSRTIGRRFRLVQIFFRGGKIIEVSTFRSKSEFDREKSDDENGQPGQNTFGTPAEDAFRRDITINGLFYNVDDFTVVDYVDGLKDLREGVIRSIGIASERFHEDPVRMIRVVRHAGRTGFSIEPVTYQAVLELRQEIKGCSLPRVRDEFLRDLGGGAAGPVIELLIETGILFVLYPEYKPYLVGNGNTDAAENRAMLLRGLKVVDRGMAGPNPPPRAVLLAMFLMPMFDRLIRSQPLPVGRKQATALNRLIHDRIKPLLVEWSFFKRDSEQVCQILAAQPQLLAAVSRGIIPGVLSRKTYYESALILCQMVCSLKSQSIPRILVESRPRTPWPLPLPRKRKKRRRPGRKKTAKKKPGDSSPGGE